MNREYIIYITTELDHQRSNIDQVFRVIPFISNSLNSFNLVTEIIFSNYY